jgi:hypothetical protein
VAPTLVRAQARVVIRRDRPPLEPPQVQAHAPAPAPKTTTTTSLRRTGPPHSCARRHPPRHHPPRRHPHILRAVGPTATMRRDGPRQAGLPRSPSPNSSWYSSHGPRPAIVPRVPMQAACVWLSGAGGKVTVALSLRLRAPWRSSRGGQVVGRSCGRFGIVVSRFAYVVSTSVLSLSFRALRIQGRPLSCCRGAVAVWVGVYGACSGSRRDLQ